MDKSSGGAVTSTTTYYPAGGAMRVDGVLYFILNDHLGSASTITDATGNIVGENDYYPFGETRFSTGSIPTDRLYTGQREITGLGIYHYGSRFYSPKLGRFISPDTIIPSYANPQHLNRYMYVLGNPLKYTDPTGHAEACLEGNGCGRGANSEEIWERFRNGSWDGLFAEYYVKLSIAERAIETCKADKSEESCDLMEIAVTDARNSKRWASGYVPQDDVTLATQTYPNILGGGYIDTEYSLGDDFVAPGMVDPGDPFQQSQTPTPTLTSTPIQRPTPTRTPKPTPTLTSTPTQRLAPTGTPRPTPTPPRTPRATPIPRRYGGEIID